MLNEFQRGEKIIIPKSVVRTISLEKLRGSTPLKQKQQNISNKHQPQLYPNGMDKLINKKLAISKQNQQYLGNQQKNKPQMKLQQVAQQMHEKQMKQCTFKPITNVSDPSKRSVNAFFTDQLEYCKKKNDKIEEMRAIIQANKAKQNIFRPNALLHPNHKPEDIQKVHERLYGESKNKDSTLRKDSCQQKNTSMTKSNRFKGLSRGNSSQKMSRADTKRSQVPSQQLHKISLHSQLQSGGEISCITTRKHSTDLQGRSKNQSKQLKSRQITRQPCKRLDLNIYQKKDNTKSQQFYIKKILKQMAIVIEKCGFPLVFNYMQMSLFFQKMNFIPAEASSDQSRKLLHEIWSMLQGEIFKEVSSLSVMKLVLAIMGCHNTNMVNKCIHEFWFNDEKKVQAYEQQIKAKQRQLSLGQNILMITQRDSKTIKSTFDELYLNRLKLGESQLIKEDIIDEYTFKPFISKASNEFAEKYRNRILQETEKLISENKIEFDVPEDGQIDHISLLMLDQKRKDAVLQQKREDLQRERRKQQDQSMISISQTERSSSRITKAKQPQKDRNKQLYEMGVQQNQNKKKDKSPAEIQEQKWKKQLTFKPNINPRNNILSALNSKNLFIPDYDKAVYRMHEGRKMRDRNPNKNTSPLLYLNIVMEGTQPAKIPVFSSDTMATITEKVAALAQVEQNGAQKLEKILKMQILPALKQMGIRME